MVLLYKRRHRACLWWYKYILVTFVILFQHMYTDAALESCMSGTYMTRHGSGVDICEVCKDGTFMPEADHANRQCYQCSQVVNASIEIVFKPCNISHDAIIQCVSGFFRRRARNRNAKDECIRCSHCENPTLPCATYADTVCCLPRHEAVEMVDGVYNCEERPCGYGEIFDEKTDQCVPCPENTYMPDDVHRHERCLKCAHLHNSAKYNSRVLFNCTRKSPTIFGCVEGYYRNVTGEPLGEEATCAPCTRCPPYNTTPGCFDFGDSICEAFEAKSKPTSFQVTNSAERQCCENVTCEGKPRCVNGLQCECLNYLQNDYTSMSPEVISPASGNNTVVISLIIAILCIVTIILIFLVVTCICKKCDSKNTSGATLYLSVKDKMRSDNDDFDNVNGSSGADNI